MFSLIQLKLIAKERITAIGCVVLSNCTIYDTRNLTSLIETKFFELFYDP